MTMTGAMALAEMLDGYGVTHLFHVPAVLRRSMVELERSTSIKRVRPHGEASAAYMADGFARASGRPGICAAQVVGAHNLAAGLRDAFLAHSPVIAMTGGRDPHTKFRKVYQEVDDVPAFETVTKMNVTIDAVERIPDMLRQARERLPACSFVEADLTHWQAPSDAEILYSNAAFQWVPDHLGALKAAAVGPEIRRRSRGADARQYG